MKEKLTESRFSRRSSCWTFVAKISILGPFALLSACSLGEQRVKTFPVQGAVSYRGKPVAEAMVVFHPTTESAIDHRPMAIADKNGTFSVTTFKMGDGAPAGEYSITVELRDWIDDGGERVRGGKNLLPAKYRNPDTSGIEMRVEPGDNSSCNIELD